MLLRLGRCFPILFWLTITVDAQTHRSSDRHAAVNLDAIARTSAPLPVPATIDRPIRVPVHEPGGRKASPQRARAPGRSGGAAIHTGFPAMVDEYVSTPPDTQGAVGPNHVMTMVNSGILVQSRSGTPRPNYPVTLQQFWGSLGPFDKLFDPRLLYDASGGRWIASIGANPSSANAALLLAVSQTDDPTGDWSLFEIRVGAEGFWADYPALGYNRDWIALSANLLELPPGGGYVKTALYAFDKAGLYQNGEARYTAFSDSETELTPVTDLEGNSGAFYFAQVFAGASGGRIRIGALRGPVGGESFAAGAKEIALPEGWSGTSLSGGDFGPQSGSWLKMDTGDGRLQNCVLRGGTAWCAHTIFLPAAAPTRSSIQWFAVEPAEGTLMQSGRLDDPAAKNFYAFPSITVNRNGDVLIGYTRFTAADYPSAGFAFRAGTDRAGTLQTGFIAKAGEAPYVGRGADESSNRWGDFSATVVDPLDGVTFWSIQEYAAIPTEHYPGRWATWWTSVSVIPGGGGKPR